MHEDIERILFTREQIEDKVKELAARIRDDQRGKALLMVGILRGAVLFYADLARALYDIPIHMSFMAVSSYGASTESTGVVRIQYDIEEDISGRNVLLIEDIIDTGLTLKYLKNSLSGRGPESLKTCCLLDKPERRKVDFIPDYTGFLVPDEFVVGYGLDYNENYRHLDYIGVLKPEKYLD